MKIALFKYRFLFIILAFIGFSVWFVSALVSGLNMMGGSSPSPIEAIISYFALGLGILSTLLSVVAFTIVQPKK